MDYGDGKIKRQTMATYGWKANLAVVTLVAITVLPT